MASMIHLIYIVSDTICVASVGQEAKMMQCYDANPFSCLVVIQKVLIQ